MDDHEANQKRLIANEIIRQLYEAGQADQLRILQISANRALEILKERGTVPSY